MMVWPSWAPRPLLGSASLSGSSVSVAGMRICASQPHMPSIGPSWVRIITIRNYATARQVRRTSESPDWPDRTCRRRPLGGQPATNG